MVSARAISCPSPPALRGFSSRETHKKLVAGPVDPERAGAVCGTPVSLVDMLTTIAVVRQVAAPGDPDNRLIVSQMSDTERGGAQGDMPRRFVVLWLGVAYFAVEHSPSFTGGRHGDPQKV